MNTDDMKKPVVFLITFFLLFHSCSTVKKPGAETLSIVPRSGWNALEPKPYKSHTPVQITVHHEGTKLEATDDAARKIRNIQAWGMGKDRNWADIPYHFLIAPDGTIYEGRNVNTHLLITCLGNLEVQEVPAPQLESLINLIAYASKKYNINIETISTHRDHSKQTTCPGKNLYAFFQNGKVLEESKKRAGRY
jgi:hypothetical protein